MNQLYTQLKSLADTNDGFYYTDQANQSGIMTRIFGYRVASYSDWLMPGALEARGITFDITDESNPVLICRPMHKFFNLFENPFTANINYDNIEHVLNKEDGSLISFYWYNNRLNVKSKMSHNSDQAIKALELLESNKELYLSVMFHAMACYTLNFEYVAPTNKIVLDYKEPKLILLNIRDTETGEYIPYKDIQ